MSGLPSPSKSREAIAVGLRPTVNVTGPHETAAAVAAQDRQVLRATVVARDGDIGMRLPLKSATTSAVGPTGVGYVDPF